MKVGKLVEEHFSFLISQGFSYSCSGEKNSFELYTFRKEAYTIVLSLDWHGDFLDILVKKNNRLLLETAYDAVTVNKESSDTEVFSQRLKAIYAKPSKTLSLSKRKIIQLTNLYALWVMRIISENLSQ